MIKTMLRTMVFALLAGMSLISQSAFACSDCEDEVCVLGVCACVPNVGRCPPRVEPTRHEFCNITTNNPVGDGKPSCKNCSSLMDGDAGKADCLARHQGNYVQFGACNPADCGRLESIFSNKEAQGLFGASKEQIKSNKNAPLMLSAEAFVIESLKQKAKPVTAVALLKNKDGKKFRCKYVMDTRRSSEGGKKVQYIPKSEQCKSVKK